MPGICFDSSTDVGLLFFSLHPLIARTIAQQQRMSVVVFRLWVCVWLMEYFVAFTYSILQRYRPSINHLSVFLSSTSFQESFQMFSSPTRADVQGIIIASWKNCAEDLVSITSAGYET